MGKTSNKSIRKVDATAAVNPQREMKRIKKEVIFLPAKLQETLHISEGKKKKEEICSSEYSSSQKPETLLATPQSTGSNTVFFSSLNLQAGPNDLIDFFKDAGKIVDICFMRHENGQSKGFGHIEFATSEGAQKALQLNGAIMLHRVVRLGTTPDWRVRWSYPCGVFVRGFDYSHGEEESRRALTQHFGSCGVISSVTTFASASSRVSGIAYVKFKDVLSVNKALELNGSELGERYLTVEEARIGGGDFDGSGTGIGGLWNTSPQFCRGDGRFGSKGGCFGDAGEDVKHLTNQASLQLTQPETLLATPQSTGSNTVFFSSLNLQAGPNDLIDFFKDAGKIVGICFMRHENGQSKGFGHIEFATSEGAQKALQLSGKIMLHRVVRLGTTPDWRVRWSYPCGIFVRGFDYSHGEEESRRALVQHFGSCGVISSVTAFASASSRVSGIAYVKFKDVLSVNKALELNGSELGERYLTVEEARIGGGDFDGSGTGIGGLWNTSPQFCRGDGRFGSGRLFSRCGRGRETPNKPNHRCS